MAHIAGAKLAVFRRFAIHNAVVGQALGQAFGQQPGQQAAGGEVAVELQPGQQPVQRRGIPENGVRAGLGRRADQAAGAARRPVCKQVCSLTC